MSKGIHGRRGFRTRTGYDINFVCLPHRGLWGTSEEIKTIFHPVKISNPRGIKEMAKENPLYATLAALLRTSHDLFHTVDFSQLFVQYLRHQSIENPLELSIYQHLVTEAMPLSAEVNESWIGWIQLDHCLHVRDGRHEQYVLHSEHTVPFRIPPR